MALFKKKKEAQEDIIEKLSRQEFITYSVRILTAAGLTTGR